MEKVINKPLSETFSWLRMGGAKLDLPEAEEKVINVAEGESETLVLEKGSAFLEIKACLEKDSSLDLIQISEDGDCAVTDIKVNCRDGAAFHWYRLVLGGKKTYDNCSVSLEGKKSSFTADIGYSLKDDEIFDVNCEALHVGKQTESAIKASGVLDGNAKKLMRGTIDFRNGSSGSVGNETEDVLLLSDSVVNKSVPVILCSEEDVEGNHGATIGMPDERIIYYMNSRGISEDEALMMLSRAKLTSVINKIPDDKIREALEERIG